MRLLVVEDERVTADVLARGLREHAYVVDVAGDGRAALERDLVNDHAGDDRRPITERHRL